MTASFLGALACAALAASSEGDNASAAEVKATMRGNFAALVALQPLLISPTAFADPANAAVLEQSLNLLGRVQHRPPRAEEPMPNAIAGLFGEALDRARAELAAGHREQARLRLRGLTGLCMGCHARKPVAADLNDLGRAGEALRLPPLERAEFFAATRQFDAALMLWADVLRDPPKAAADAFIQAQVARRALLVSVRVKDDPVATLELLKMVKQRPELPRLMRTSLEAWLKDAEAWKGEGFVSAKKTPEQLMARAQKLIAATGAERSLLMGDERLVPLLRASGYLDEALARAPNAASRGEALYLLGVATAALFDADLWDLDQLFLEACVRENPHTPLAVKCVDRFADRMLLLYSGSGGTRVPPDQIERLVQLRALAR
jgi:hypothetical protein